MMTRICEGCGQPRRVKEPNALGTARYDPLIDIAYEQLTSRHGVPQELRRQAERRVALAGGIEHVRAMRSPVQL